MANIYALLSSIHIGAASGWDVVIGSVLLTGLFVYGFFLGRNRMIVLLLSTYFSWAIVNVIPWRFVAGSEVLSTFSRGTSASSTHIFIFIGLICFFYFMMPRSVLSSPLRIRKKGEAVWWQLLLLSVMQLGLLAMVILSFMPMTSTQGLSFVVQRIFVGEGARFIWTALPILGIMAMRRKKLENNKS